MSDPTALRGMPAILAFVNTIIDPPLTDRALYGMFDRGELSGGKLGGQWVVCREILRLELDAISRGQAWKLPPAIPPRSNTVDPQRDTAARVERLRQLKAEGKI